MRLAYVSQYTSTMTTTTKTVRETLQDAETAGIAYRSAGGRANAAGRSAAHAYAAALPEAIRPAARCAYLLGAQGSRTAVAS